MKARLIAVIAAAAVSVFAATTSHAAVTDQLVDLAKPNGTQLRYLLTADDAARARIGVILFTGDTGLVHLDRGVPGRGGNFLVRSRRWFARDGLAAAVYDPSADLGPLSDGGRMSEAHAAEVAQVLQDFKQQTGVEQVYLVGTSRGTISAVYVARALKDQVAGVVLSSTLFRSSKAGPGLSGFDFSSIGQPLLFVHHVADGCRVTPPGDAQRLADKYPVIWIEGLEGKAGESCGPYSEHGYLGRESVTVQAVADWILTRKMPGRNPVQ